ncbi:PREDICTED: uncharacterized protein LOC109391199 isoform X1 [Hipposideros armiger]|uniref:Uncharacterized protein LOC109391199 isoform X1 n=1 Tax=Hipposideros armiger TaxID=186990 RepID=A0A8B7SN64_HIPAR|nr:PREDICTED: uncharacterized protein LOC109391199 isoform X1 [Hipposideros armiger]
MGRKKTLQDYAAEFTDLVVKQHLIELSDSGDTSVVETLYCPACELPVRVRRDRILGHLSTGRHYRNRRLFKQHSRRAPALICAASELPGAGLATPRSHAPLCPPPPLLLLGSACTAVPSAPAGRSPLLPGPPSAATASPRDVPAREKHMPSSSASHLAAFPALPVKRPSVPSAQAHQTLLSEASSTAAPRGGTRGLRGVGAVGSGRLGLAVFGAGCGSRALLRRVMDESGCCLLYVVEDQPCDVARAFRAECLSNTRVVPERDADVVLTDQRVSGVIVCSPPEAASQIVMAALRAGKGVLCEGLPGLDRQTAASCFDEADRRGRPLVCGFYKRFDPAVQFLHKKVCDGHTLGRLHRVTVISSVYPAASPGLLRKSGGVFYSVAVHDVDIVSTLLGERTPDTVFTLGSALCQDVASLKDADTVVISMKFPSGAIVSLDISQHCTKSCDQRLEVHGSQGSLRLDNQKPLGISSQGPALSLVTQTQAERYQEAYRQLFRHFLRTLQGKEPPAVSREQLLGALRVATAAERSWWSRAAVDLRHEAGEAPVVKTEAP